MKNSIRKLALLLSIYFLFTLGCYSQNKERFVMNIDFASFRYDSSSTYLELYYSFSQSQFKLKVENSNFMGSAIISLKLKLKSNDSIIISKKWKAPFSLQDTLNINEKALIGVTGFIVPFGEYVINIVGNDEYNQNKTASLNFEIKSSSFDKNRVSISDPQLSSSIQQIPRDDKNIFYKNTLEVIPNPSLVYGLGLPILYVYAETYNLNKLKNQEYKYVIDVYNSNSKKVKSSSKPKKKQFESSVEVSTVNCTDLASGVYILRCSILDEKDTSLKAASYKRFFVYNPHLDTQNTAESGDLLSNEYAMMTEQEIQKEFSIAKYLSSKEEIDEFEKSASLSGKKNFMVKFWKKRNTDESSLTNPAKEKFQKSVNYSNQHFRTGQREGWKTDRGRVYIIYGTPDETERHPNEIDAKPYEIWYYNNIEGGIIFVFVDKSTMGDYSLVHSTYRNEIRDDSWQRHLK